MELTEITDRAAWDQWVSRQPWGHPLQLWGWGEAKRDNGWTAHRLVLAEGERWLAGVQVLVWTIPRVGRRIAYVPRGPVAAAGSPAAQRLLAALAAWAKARRMLYVRIEPAWTEGDLGPGWVRARHQLQMRETYTIDLRQPEAQLLEGMARKHRQYIRKAERDGVTVVEGTDLAPMYQLYEETARRAGFGIHAEEYYATLQRELGEQARLFYATADGRPVAFLWLAMAGRTAYELYGGVSAQGAELKANYVLKWQAIAAMKAAGLDVYDFNGRVTEGVAQFKAGFGAVEVDYIGTWDYPLNALGYRLWEQLWPVAKVVGRQLARVRRR